MRYCGGWILDEMGRCRQEPNGAKAWQWRRAHPELWKIAWDDVGTAEVSTVFLSIDHSFEEHGPPILFETMVFEPGTFRDRYCRRYTSWWEAMAGHAETVQALRDGTLTMDDAVRAERPDPPEKGSEHESH